MAHYCLLSPHPAGTILSPGFSEMLVDFTAVRKSRRFLGLPLACLDVLLPISLPSKLGCCHLTLPFLLLNHGSRKPLTSSSSLLEVCPGS